MRFDWTDLRVFLHACETGSMTEAARRANLTLAAVSARIRALERHAGVLLLRRLFHQLEVLRRDIAPLAPLEPAHTVLLANSSAQARPLYRVIADVLGEHPTARLRARESASEVTVHALHTGAADVGIVADAANTRDLVVAELGADPLVLIAPPGHPLSGRKSLPFSAAFAHDWVGWGEGSALQTHLDVQAWRAGGVLQTRASVPSSTAVVELVARGFGISVLPRAVLRRLVRVPQVAVLELQEAWAQRKLLVCRSQACEAPVALALFDAFRVGWRALEDME
jgi:DNA-binding transcriptional LysR family regulator